MSRRYHINAKGEETPVWASARKLREMGRDHGARCFVNGGELTRWRNLAFDQAAREEFDRLTKSTLAAKP